MRKKGWQDKAVDAQWRPEEPHCRPRLEAACLAIIGALWLLGGGIWIRQGAAVVGAIYLALGLLQAAVGCFVCGIRYERMQRRKEERHEEKGSVRSVHV